MSYRIEGLSPAPYEDLFGLSDEALAARGAIRMTADSTPGFPCRITLEDAEPGETLLLLNHVSQAAATPYRASHAIFVREGAREPALYVDETPPVFAGRTLSLRGFDARGMMQGASLALPGEADARIRELFAQPEIVSIHAHNATRGCFAARIERN
jgi:Protein of unknown function (DUF1203)